MRGIVVEEKISQLHDQYYEAIKQLQDKDDIINSLPNTDYNSFFDIIDVLIEKLEIDKKETIQLIASETNYELREYYQQELDLLEFKLECCSNRLEEAKSLQMTENFATMTNKKNIIFATTTSGNIYLEKDLKNIPEEYLDSILDAINQLKDGIVENNEEKGKKLRSNQKLSGLHEIKLFKVRIIYRNLSPDLVFLIGTKMKKSDNDKKDREEIIDRKDKTNSEFKELIEKIKDPKNKQMLIDQNRIILNNICNKINTNKRGRDK